jgi:23S rRNA pseudouridine2604 synthase
MLCGLQIDDFKMTTRPKLGLPSKSDRPTTSDRDPARKPVRNSTARSRTLSRNTTQVAPAAKAARDGAPARTHAEKTARAPRRDVSDRPPRAGTTERPPRGDFVDRAPRGERPARASGIDDASKRSWTPRPERDNRSPRAQDNERSPRSAPGDRAPRRDAAARTAGPSGTDGTPKRPWTPRPERDSRPPRAENGARTPHGAKPAAPPLHPARPWEERETDRKGRVKAVAGGDDGGTSKDGIRVSRWLADRGAASRREADDWIVRGWVTVDGEVAVLGQRVLSHQKVEVNKEARADQALRVTVLMHKPVGFVSGQAEDGHEPASVLFVPENQWQGDRSGQTFNRNHLRGLAPAGRLDIDSHGLLVLTQDGRVARVLIGEDSTIEKEYLVRVRAVKPFGQGPLSETFPDASMTLLNHGLELDGQPLKPAKVSWQNEEQLRFVLREGKKRQIRRMCEAVGLDVVALKRVRIGRIPLADLPVGKWRYLRPDEAF